MLVCSHIYGYRFFWFVVGVVVTITALAGWWCCCVILNACTLLRIIKDERGGQTERKREGERATTLGSILQYINHKHLFFNIISTRQIGKKALKSSRRGKRRAKLTPPFEF